MSATNSDAVLSFAGGPYDGAEIDAATFGARLPNALLMGFEGRTAWYELDIAAAGPFYRFYAWRPRTPCEADGEIARLRAERAREAARALVAEARQRRAWSAAGRRRLEEGQARLWDRRLSIPEPKPPRFSCPETPAGP